MERVFEGVKWLAEGVKTVSFKRKENPASSFSVLYTCSYSGTVVFILTAQMCKTLYLSTLYEPQGMVIKLLWKLETFLFITFHLNETYFRPKISLWQ